MNNLSRFVLIVIAIMIIALPASAQDSHWHIPNVGEPGGSVELRYDTYIGELPSDQDVFLFWAINEDEGGSWTIPPDAIIPEGSVVYTDEGVKTPMTQLSDNIWALELTSNDQVTSFDYYFITDAATDHNGGDNWHILVRTPTVSELPHPFTLDPRSSRLSVQPDDIEDVFLAGPFNNWSTSADRMLYNEESGVYFLERTLPVGETLYKFVINGDVWVKDPDNLLSEGVGDDNSIADVAPYQRPVFRKTRPLDQRVIPVGESITFQAYVSPSGYANGLDGEPEMYVDGEPFDFNWVSSYSLMYCQMNLEEGTHDILLRATDDLGLTATHSMRLTWHDQGNGYYMPDLPGDDNGSGFYRYPEGRWGLADIWGIEITEVDNGNTMAFDIAMNNVEDETRLLLQISNNLLGAAVDPAYSSTETATPEWNGIGLQIVLVDPDFPSFDPAVHNRLIVQRQPVVMGESIDVSVEDNHFNFEIGVDQLEEILGSYNHPWYFGGYSYLEGYEGTSGGSWEIDAVYGGSDDVSDPDAFDALFVDRSELQKTLFEYFTGNNRSTLDEVGRGFALIAPENIGPNVGSNGPVVRMLSGGGSTWHPNQTIYGMAEFENSGDVVLTHTWDGGSQDYTFTSIPDTFSVDLVLEEGLNVFTATATENGETSFTPEMHFNLDINHSPVVRIQSSVNGDIVTVDASDSYDPDEQNISFNFEADTDNPAAITLTNVSDGVVSFEAPAIAGEYYINLEVEDTDGNISTGRTFATVYPDSVHAFNTNEAARWVRDAIIYSIYPRGFTHDFHLHDVIDEMDRLETLGITAIWFTPIFPGPTGHGYEITDYRDIHSDFGTLDDFADLVTAAHDHGIKIILDNVYNHTALAHPYFQNTVIFDEFSHYYDWYMRDAEGNYEYLFNWASMPNINLDNDEAREYFIATSEWWVKNYDVDGFRCDVAWGVQQRHDDFWVDWRQRLKTLRPEILLLGEANAREPVYFDNRFDLVYDWYLHHEASQSFTSMFTVTPNPSLLHEAILNDGDGFEPYKAPFRFLENHDEDRFIAEFSIDQTKLALSLLMSIPGVPMIYAGEEWGEATRREPLARVNQEHMYQLTYKLIRARRLLPAMTSSNIEQLECSAPNSVYAFSRYEDNEYPVVAIHNLTNEEIVNVNVTVPVEELGLDTGVDYYLNDMLNETQTQMSGQDLETITVDLQPYASFIYSISDTAMVLDVIEQSELPQEFQLKQNYPNPFNPTTTIAFTIPHVSDVRLEIYNLLGQKVRTLFDGPMQSGEHKILWDGRSDNDTQLSSGVYFYRINAGENIKTRKMLLVK